MNNKPMLGKLLIVSALLLQGCVQTPQNYPVAPGRMQAASNAYIENEIATNDQQATTSGLVRLSALPENRQQPRNNTDLAAAFSNNDQVQLTANQLPLNALVQRVLGELLQVNYVIAKDINVEQLVNLNIQQPVSSRQLFLLLSQLLQEEQLQLSLRDNVYFVHPISNQTNANLVIGIGRRYQDVPDTVQRILQVVPLRYGLNLSLERTLNNITSVRVTPDNSQNVYFLEGSRTEVLQALDVIALLDMPSTRGKFVGLLNLTYVTPAEFITKITELLQAEGIRSGTPAMVGSALVMSPIEQIGAVALFAAEEFVLNRAEFWATQIDRPSNTGQPRYFIYHPKYARAADLGQSVSPLLGVSPAGTADQSRDTQSAQSAARTVLSAQGEGVRLTVDERSNTLLFYTTGERYQSLLPIVQRLDVLPKQILLDATIAEVTLTNEFAQGFEFAFRSGKLTGGTRGAFGVNGMGGFSLNWADGVSSVIARLSASSSLINVLSNPTLVVRDGVSANITVGNDIPTLGSTTVNPGTETESRSIVYRKTGVSLSVTPTINAQGLVVLEIDQTISNASTTGPQLDGSPSIFERSIKTEVLAQSGQTVLLGGLISENNTDGGSHVPGLSRLPLVGHLFKGQEQKREKTELVIFITPRVIDSVEQWQQIRATIAESLTSISLID